MYTHVSYFLCILLSIIVWSNKIRSEVIRSSASWMKIQGVISILPSPSLFVLWTSLLVPADKESVGHLEPVVVNSCRPRWPRGLNRNYPPQTNAWQISSMADISLHPLCFLRPDCPCLVTQVHLHIWHPHNASSQSSQLFEDFTALWMTDTVSQ